MEAYSKHQIILFDGVCNLCNHSVTFIIERDRNDVFKFAALQSEIGKEIATNFGIDISETQSIVLVAEGKAYQKSSAALRIARQLSQGYPLLYMFMIVPKFIRDAMYTYIAKNRYKWFGKKESCMIPGPELIDKFL